MAYITPHFSRLSQFRTAISRYRRLFDVGSNKIPSAIKVVAVHTDALSPAGGRISSALIVRAVCRLGNLETSRAPCSRSLHGARIESHNARGRRVARYIMMHLILRNYRWKGLCSRAVRMRERARRDYCTLALTATTLSAHSDARRDENETLLSAVSCVKARILQRCVISFAAMRERHSVDDATERGDVACALATFHLNVNCFWGHYRGRTASLCIILMNLAMFIKSLIPATRVY